MVTIKKLNCGTTVIMEKSERVQSAALGIWVRAGASDEWDEVSGVSHFIEHMMFKGGDLLLHQDAVVEHLQRRRNFARHADWFEVRSGGNGPGKTGHLRGDQDGERYA